MINWIVDKLLRWDPLRTAIFAEVDWQNSIARILEDEESMKTAAAMWCEEDGWRGWTIQDNGNYYFNDVPEKSISDIFNVLEEAGLDGDM